MTAPSSDSLLVATPDDLAEQLARLVEVVGMLAERQDRLVEELRAYTGTVVPWRDYVMDADRALADRVGGLQAGLEQVAAHLRTEHEHRLVRSVRDIETERQRQSLESTARFVEAELGHLTGLGGTLEGAKAEILRQAVRLAPAEGLALEFGVATGTTLRQIVALRGAAHGFDSFEGLPEHWRSGFGAGRFAQDVPDVPGAELHVGWFADTLPAFLAEHPEPFAFVHMDADLYSSTKCVFDLAFDRFRPGTVILFDEYFNYPGWEAHEHLAFREFLERYDGGFEYVAYTSVFEQVAVVLG